jgi:hypothetical protein
MPDALVDSPVAARGERWVRWIRSYNSLARWGRRRDRDIRDISREFRRVSSAEGEFSVGSVARGGRGDIRDAN